MIASPDGRDRSVKIYQDAYIYASILEDGKRVAYEAKPDRYTWIQVAKGTVTVGSLKLQAGDAVSSDRAEKLEITAQGDAELLVFDLA